MSRKGALLDTIKDIEDSLKNGTYIAATALALTLPDICCQVENGTMDSNRTMYIDWVNQHIEPEDFIFPIPGFERQTFDGKMCYALRCRVLHNGSTDVEQSQMRIDIDAFVLTKPGDEKYYKGYRYGEVQQSDGSKKIVTVIAADYLCEILCDAAERFYNNWNNKADFSAHSIWQYS